MGVADVFALQNDGTVQAITSDGTTAWTADMSAYTIHGGTGPAAYGGADGHETRNQGAPKRKNTCSAATFAGFTI